MLIQLLIYIYILYSILIGTVCLLFIYLFNKLQTNSTDKNTVKVPDQ